MKIYDLLCLSPDGDTYSLGLFASLDKIAREIIERNSKEVKH